LRVDDLAGTSGAPTFTEMRETMNRSARRSLRAPQGAAAMTFSRDLRRLTATLLLLER
jgi:hypothetical protein